MNFFAGMKSAAAFVSSFSQHYPGNDERYVDNVIDVRVSLRESLIRSLERGRPVLHPKLPKSESLKDCMDRTIPYWVKNIEGDAIQSGAAKPKSPAKK